jgi:flagellar biosynthesis regulator FlaF
MISFEIARVLQGQGILSDSEVEDIQAIRKIWNEVVHGKLDHKNVLNREIVKKLISLNVKIEQRLSTQGQ